MASDRPHSGHQKGCEPESCWRWQVTHHEGWMYCIDGSPSAGLYYRGQSQLSFFDSTSGDSIAATGAPSLGMLPNARIASRLALKCSIDCGHSDCRQLAPSASFTSFAAPLHFNAPKLHRTLDWPSSNTRGTRGMPVDDLWYPTMRNPACPSHRSDKAALQTKSYPLPECPRVRQFPTHFPAVCRLRKPPVLATVHSRAAPSGGA